VRTVFYTHAKCTDDSKSIDVDQLWNQKSADAFVLHGTNLVYVVTFSEKVCTQLHELAQAQSGLSISYPIDNNVIEGAKLVGNSDQMQKNESAVYTANLVPPFAHKGRHSLIDPKGQLKLMLQLVVPMVVGS
jgi:hypothetical protein